VWLCYSDLVGPCQGVWRLSAQQPGEPLLQGCASRGVAEECGSGQRQEGLMEPHRCSGAFGFRCALRLGGVLTAVGNKCRGKRRDRGQGTVRCRGRGWGRESVFCVG